MKAIKLRFMTRKEWVLKYKLDEIKKMSIFPFWGCPRLYGLKDSWNKCSYGHLKCEYCWNLPAQIDGKYILVRSDEK